MEPVTLYDVAARVGVSAKTVSRVINGERGVSATTRQRVLETIDELDYRPSLLARGLSGTHAYTIGLACDNPNAYFILALQRGALRACNAASFGLQMYPCDSLARSLAGDLRALVGRLRLSGLVLTPPVSERPTALRALRELGIPFATILSAVHAPGRDAPCVYVNDRVAACAVTTHLLRLGHVRIGFLKGNRHHRSSGERLRGYRRALLDYAVPLRRELVVEGDYVFDDGFRGARRLLALARPPTAIFGCNDEVAAGAMAAVRSLGLRVPQDVSIAGFEDSEFSRYSWPQITTARQRADVIAEHATAMLIARIKGLPVHNEEVNPELVVRESTAPPVLPAVSIEPARTQSIRGRQARAGAAARRKQRARRANLKEDLP